MEARVEKPHRIAGYCRISVDVEADRDNTSIEKPEGHHFRLCSAVLSR